MNPGSEQRREIVSPHNLDAETSVLGAILVRNSALADVEDIISADSFFREAHGVLFREIRALAATGVGVDLVTLTHQLERSGDLERVGGAVYVASLTDGVPASASVQYYAGIVREMAMLRSVYAFATQTIRRCTQERWGGEDLLAQTEADLLALARQSPGREELVPPSQLVADAIKELERRTEQKKFITGTTTGLADLDVLLRGLNPGHLIVLGARTAMGKTALALQIAIAAANEGAVAFFSLEMTRSELMARAFSVLEGLDSYQLATGRLSTDGYRKVVVAAETIRASGLHVNDTSELAVSSIMARARRLQWKQHLALVVIDYLQLVRPDAKRHSDNRAQDVAGITRALKLMAKDLGVPVLVLSQLSRATETRPNREPFLSDLRESGSIEQDADVVLLLHRPGYHDQTVDRSRAELIVAKNRHGPTGRIALRWSDDRLRFDALIERER